MIEVTNNTPQNQSVIIMTGMHRSGTSLTASLLQNSGVFIGERLMDGGTGNIKGHFEDWDFVDLHRESLTAASVNREGWTTQKNFTLSGEYLERAKTLIAARSQYPIWGWKDPRTTLFLDCWQDLIPEAKFVFVYRSPWDVVDSLFRRGDFIFKIEPEIAILSWISYNQKILNFCRQTSRPWILLKIEDMINDSPAAIAFINQQLKLSLPLPQNLYERSLFKDRTYNYHWAKLIQKYYPQALQLYIQLHQQATYLAPTSTNVNLNSLSHPPFWFWQNWLDKPIERVRATLYWFKLKQLAANTTKHQ